MSSHSRRIPKYRHYKPKDLGVVRIDGRDHYLGKHDSPARWEKYHRLIAEWLSNDRVANARRSQRAQLSLTHPDTEFGDYNDLAVESVLSILRKDHGQPPPASDPILTDSTETAIRDAQKIHENNDILTWQLQAWLLTGESVYEAAERLRLPVETTIWYERLFFDVGTRLRSPSFITHHVIGPKIHYGLSIQDVDVIWRYWAYIGGPHILESLLADFEEANRPDYGYLFDGTYRNADLPNERKLLHQALRVQLLSSEDILRIIKTALKHPEIIAKAPSLDELIELLASPVLDWFRTAAKDECEAPVEDVSGAAAGESGKAGAA